MLCLLLPQQNLADELVEELVAEVEVRPDDHAGDDHDDRALDDLVLPGPLDLAELADRLGDEPLRAGERQLAAAGLARRGLKGGPDRRLAAAVAHRALPRLASRAALRPAGASHLDPAPAPARPTPALFCDLRRAYDHRVSLCAVWRPHQR